MITTDLIIIGAGPGGYRAAEYAAKNGLKVVIFECSEVGGTCLNVGCIPTKTYVHSATFDEARERMASVVPQLRAGVEGILSHPNISLVREKAQFGEGVVLAGGEQYTAPNIIIATGSETKWLPIEGVRTNPHVVDSTGLLNLQELPRRLCIIGAGVIGMEFASVFHRFGSEVTVIEYLKECLPALDSDIAKRLRKLMEKGGITFHMQCAVKHITDGIVTFETKKGQQETVEADIILMATGRKPRTSDLSLSSIGITPSPTGSLPVDSTFRLLPPSSSPNISPSCVPSVASGKPITSFLLPPSSQNSPSSGMNISPSSFLLPPSSENSPSSSPNIPHSTFHIPHSTSFFSIGDSNGLQLLAHAAEMQAIHVVNHILGKSDNIRFDIMPAAIFTSPEAACVGPSEDQLKSQGIDYVCKKSFWRSNGKALAMNESEGLLKLFVSSSDGMILGCHAYGSHASDIVQEVSVLMCKSTTIHELSDMVHIHPTLSEILKSAAEA